MKDFFKNHAHSGAGSTLSCEKLFFLTKAVTT